MADDYVLISEMLAMSREEFDQLDRIVEWVGGEASDPARPALTDAERDIAITAAMESSLDTGAGTPPAGDYTFEGPTSHLCCDGLWLRSSDDIDVEFWAVLCHRLLKLWGRDPNEYASWTYAYTSDRLTLHSMGGGAVCFNSRAIEWSKHPLPKDLPGVLPEEPS